MPGFLFLIIDMITGIIILSVLLAFWIALFFIYYYQVNEVNEIQLLKIPGAELTFDIREANKFNIAKIVKALDIPIKSPLYTVIPDEEAYLEKTEANFITARVTNKRTGIKITRKYDRYGIDVKDTRTKRRPRNCQVFLVPRASKFSWYTITGYTKTVKESVFEEPGISFDRLQAICSDYCKNYCFLECSKKCSLKNITSKKNRMEIIEKIDKYCEQDCSFGNDCSDSSCVLYKIKNR